MKKITFLVVVLFPILIFGQLTNTTFDTDISGWTNQNAATVSWDGTEGFTALGSLKIEAGSALNTGTRSTPNDSPNSGGGNYLLSCKVKGAMGTEIQLVVFQGGFNGGSITTLATNDWEDISFTFDYLDSSNLNVRILAKTANATYFIDDVSFSKVVTVKNTYLFDNDDVAEGWADVSGTNSGPTSGILTFSPTADSFAKLRQEAHSVDASNNSHMRILMQNLSTNDDELRVIVPGGGNETITITTSDATEQTYEIDLSAVSGWTGEITELELGFRDADNPNGNGRSSGTGDFLINSIEFYTPGPTLITSAQTGSWSDTATWTGGVVPLSIDDVQIDHEVTISDNETANSVTISTGNSLLINKGNSLFLTGDLMLDTNVNNSLIVRGDANQFGSLIVDGTVTGDIRYRRYVNDYENPGGNDLIAPPVLISAFNDFYNDNGSFLFEDAGNVLFGPFNNMTSLYETWNSGNTTALILGKGYRAGTNGTLAETSALNFHGSVNTGNVDIDITDESGSFGQWNLIGNPYPSYISLEDFLVVNGSKTASGIYGYDGDASDGWTIWNQSFSDMNSGAVITPGQGFFVASQNASATINFTPSMRRIGATEDFIPSQADRVTSNHLGYFRLNLTGNSTSYHTDFYFNANASKAYDQGYDSELFSLGANNLLIYSHLVEDNVGDNMAIQSLGQSELSDVIIPLGIHAQQGTQVTISILDIDLPASTEIYLEDNLTNTFTLLNTSDYTFTPASNLAGTGRFYIHVVSSVLSIDDSDLRKLEIYKVLKSSYITIRGNLSATTNFRLYDIQGRLVKEKRIEVDTANEYDVNVSDVSSGIYIVELKNKGQKYSQKLIID